MLATGNSCETQRSVCPTPHATATFFHGGVHPPEQPPANPAFTVYGWNFNPDTDVIMKFFDYPAGDYSPFERTTHSDGNGDVRWSAPIPPDGMSLPKIRPDEENEHRDVFIILRDPARCLASVTVDSFGFNQMF